MLMLVAPLNSNDDQYSNPAEGVKDSMIVHNIISATNGNVIFESSRSTWDNKKE
jgi:hypothetical protein